MAISKIGTASIGVDVIVAEDIANNAITVAELQDDAVTIAKLAATGTADATTFLRGDNTWTAVNTDLVGDTTPQLGGALDAQGNNITDVGNIETSTTTKIKQKGEFMTHSIHRSWVMGG